MAVSDLDAAVGRLTDAIAGGHVRASDLLLLENAAASKPEAGLFADIAAWSAETFPASGAGSTFNHLEREIRELYESLSRTPPGSHESAMEMADVAFLLIQLARVEGIDLLAAIREKFEINKARTWQPPDADGVVEHVREPNPLDDAFPF